MKKYLFLDDERMPTDVKWILIGNIGSYDISWHIVRTFADAIDWVNQYGFPDVISFDHDLGDGQNGYDFAKWLVEYDLLTNTMPENFLFTVHSMNPIGCVNITSYLNNYIRIKNENRNS